MIRACRGVGLAFVAALALSAASAPAASAQEEEGMLTADGPVTLTGAQNLPLNSNAFTVLGINWLCPESTYTGHAGSKSTFILPGSTTVSLMGHYKGCTMTGFPATIEMNGCDYVVHFGETSGEGDEPTYEASFDVACPPEEAVVMTVFLSHTQLTEGKSFCDVEFHAHTGLQGLHVTDNTDGSLTVAGTVKGITAITKPTSVFCSHKTTETGEFHINVTVKGLNGAGQSTSVSLSHQ